jgi:hypothetical protein
MLAVQEVGDPTALADLAKTVGGCPHTAATSRTDAGSASGLCLSFRCSTPTPSP